MHMGEAISALECGLRAEAQGEALNMVKTHLLWNHATLHATGAVFPKAGFAGTKTWAHTEGGTTPLLILFDSQNGALKAIIEAFAMGQMRTGAASGVATRWLAAENADELAIIGTGKQAITQVAPVLAVRRIKRIRVFGRNEERRSQFVERLKREFDCDVAAAKSIREAVENAPIITTVTRATEPFLTAEMVGRGAHINSVGAIEPSRAELAADLFPRCRRIVVDNVAQAQKLSRELMDYLGPNQAEWEKVQPLSQVVASGQKRSAAEDLTLFKSLGMGISDLSLGMELYQRALRAGAGRRLPQPEKVQPRLKTAQ